MAPSRALTPPRTAVIALVPLALVLACPKGKGGDAADAAPSASLSTTESATAWSPAPSTSYEDDASVSSDFDDGEGDEELVDASIDDAGDATDGDARKRIDAADDAPLMGTKTFPDEEPMTGFRYITSDAAKVHKAPKDGKAFLSIQRGTQVWLLGRQYDWYRIKFEDPSLGVIRQGWIYILNIVGPRMKSCPEGWVHHDQDGGWCERECTKNTDCKALPGWKCSGTGCFYAVVQ